MRKEGDSFPLIFERNPLPMYVYDKETLQFLDVNAAAVRFYGYSRAEFLAMTICDIRPEEDVPAFLKFLESAFEKFSHDAEWRHRKKNGELCWVDVDSHEFSYAGRPARLVFAKDITEKKKAEIELFNSKQFADRVNDTIPDILYIFDAVERRNVFCNRSILTHVGYSPDEIKELGDKVIGTLIHPDDLRLFLQHQARYETLKDGDVIEIEYRMMHKDGKSRWFRSSEAVFKRDPGGKVRQVIGLCKNVHDRKIAEEQLIQREAFFKSIFDGVSTMLAVLERSDGDVFLFVAMNQALRDVLGTEMVNSLMFKSVDNCRGLLPPGTVQELEELLNGCAGQSLTTEKDIELTLDDEETWWHIRFSPVRNHSGGVARVIVFIQPISDKKREEEAKERNQRLESVGFLAGGIAHDFNNFLSAIVMNASLLKVKEPAHGQCHEYVEDILKVCEEAQHLTKQLLTFAKGGMPVKTVADVGELLREAARFALRGTQIACEYRIPDKLHKADIDIGQIKQVVYNLVLNAREVLGEGGRIVITAENIDVPQEKGSSQPFVSFSVEDNGPGIPLEAQRNIFNPYYTTKKTGNGLGLAICHSVVAKHGGSIQFQSTPGKGTVFSVTLPAVTTQERIPKPLSPDAVVKGSGLVVIMDDNEMILNTLSETLKMLGYEAVRSAHGEACLEEFKKIRAAGRRVDALILDLTIQGGMGGIETLRRLKQIDPDVKAIASSGYSEEETSLEFSQLGFSAVLPKPYRLADLSRILAEVTAENSGNV